MEEYEIQIDLLSKAFHLHTHTHTHTCVTVLVYVECLYLLLKVVRLSHFPHFYNPPFKDYFSWHGCLSSLWSNTNLVFSNPRLFFRSSILFPNIWQILVFLISTVTHPSISIFMTSVFLMCNRFRSRLSQTLPVVLWITSTSIY